MKVKLVAYTPEADDICGVAAGTCVSEHIPPRGYIYGEWSKNANVLRHALDSGHESVAEHAVFTFAIEGISRACSHQLVRHRMASYSQQSQRYVNMNGFEYVTPESIGDTVMGKTIDWITHEPFDVTVRAEYECLMEHISDTYARFIELGVPEEDARYILPNACTTNLVVTMNARELIHFCGLRRCTRAQWEIRELADEMAKLVIEVAPILGSYMVPKCQRTGICTERKSCGKIKEVRE